jgi:nicotinate dehydrogenase subunit A
VNGVIMTAKAYLDRNARASDAAIRQALSGVLCRCGAHTRMMLALRQYAQGIRR